MFQSNNKTKQEHFKKTTNELINVLKLPKLKNLNFFLKSSEFILTNSKRNKKTMKRREIYFKEFEITLETPLSDLFTRYENLLFEIDRLSPKSIEYFDRELIINEMLEYLQKSSPDPSDYQRTYKLPYFAQQLLVDRAGFFVDIFLGVSLAAKYAKEMKEMAMKLKLSYSNKIAQQQQESSSSSGDSDSDSSDSDSSDEDEDSKNTLQRKRSKTDSLTGQLPLLLEENLNERIMVEKKAEESPPKEEEKKETGTNNNNNNNPVSWDLDYQPKRSKTSFRRGNESPKKDPIVSQELIEAITVIKTVDYKYMESLCKVLEGDVNDVAVGYFQKIVSAFLTKKPMEVEFFFFERKKIRSLLLRQCSTKAISTLIVDILLDKKYLIEDDTTSRTRYNNFLLSKKAFLQEIFDLLRTSSLGSNSNMILAGLCELLSTLVKNFRLPLVEKSIFYSVFSESNLSLLLSLVNGPLSIKYVLPLLLLVLETVSPAIKEQEELKIALNHGFFIKGLLKCLPRFIETLKTTGEPLLISNKVNIETLGVVRLGIVMLAKELLKRNETETNEEIINSGILTEVFALLLRIQWNNLLHCAVEEIFNLAVTNKQEMALKQVFEGLELFEKIIEGCQENNSKQRKGVVALWINIANVINEKCEEIECFKSFVCANSKWGSFSAYWLKLVNRQQNTELGTGIFRKARLTSLIPTYQIAEKYKEILKSKDLLEADDRIITNGSLPDQIPPDELDFSPSLPKGRTKHLSLFKSRSCMTVEAGGDNKDNSNIKHHVSFTEEYDTFHKELEKSIRKELDTNHEKKIIGLKKINSKDFEYIENQDFSEKKLNPDGNNDPDDKSCEKNDKSGQDCQDDKSGQDDKGGHGQDDKSGPGEKGGPGEKSEEEKEGRQE